MVIFVLASITNSLFPEVDRERRLEMGGDLVIVPLERAGTVAGGPTSWRYSRKLRSCLRRIRLPSSYEPLGAFRMHLFARAAAGASNVTERLHVLSLNNRDSSLATYLRL